MMSMDLDAEAEMEGLFGGEDQAATQSLTQEGHERIVVIQIFWGV